MAFLKFLFTIYAITIFTFFLLLIFPLVFIATFFGKIRGGNFIYKLCCLWSDFFFFMTFIRHKNIFETPHLQSKSYVFIFNHISYLDIPMILKTIRNQHFRVLGKAEMKNIPIFGFLYKHAAILVERENPAKRLKSVQSLKAVLRKKISIVIFPEGTFNTTQKPLKEMYDGAFKIAIETNTPIKPILFLDTYSRMSYKSIFSITPGKCRAVFLDEINVEKYLLNEAKLLKENVMKIMEQKLKQYQANWIID